VATTSTVKPSLIFVRHPIPTPNSQPTTKKTSGRLLRSILPSYRVPLFFLNPIPHSANMDALGAYGSDDSDASSTNGGTSTGTGRIEVVEAKERGESTSRRWRWPCPPTIDGESSWIYGNRNYLIEEGSVVALSSSTADRPTASTKTTTTTPSNENHLPLGKRLRAHKEFQNPKHLERTVERYSIVHPFGTTATAMELAPWEYNIVSLEEQARQQQCEAASVVPASDFVQDQISRAMVRHPPSS